MKVQIKNRQKGRQFARLNALDLKVALHNARKWLNSDTAMQWTSEVPRGGLVYLDATIPFGTWAIESPRERMVFRTARFNPRSVEIVREEGGLIFKSKIFGVTVNTVTVALYEYGRRCWTENPMIGSTL